MKIFKGKRSKEGVGEQLIVVQDNGDEYLLEHIERHSPNGFQWGYSGSGPADTALSILTDCLGMGPASQLYQMFKWEFVARWGDEWSISEEKIREWAEREKETRIFLEQERRGDEKNGATGLYAYQYWPSFGYCSASSNSW